MGQLYMRMRSVGFLAMAKRQRPRFWRHCSTTKCPTRSICAFRTTKRSTLVSTHKTKTKTNAVRRARRSARLSEPICWRRLVRRTWTADWLEESRPVLSCSPTRPPVWERPISRRCQPAKPELPMTPRTWLYRPRTFARISCSFRPSFEDRSWRPVPGTCSAWAWGWGWPCRRWGCPCRRRSRPAPSRANSRWPSERAAGCPTARHLKKQKQSAGITRNCWEWLGPVMWSILIGSCTPTPLRIYPLPIHSWSTP